MSNARRIGKKIDELSSPEMKARLQSQLGISDYDFQRLLCGRLFLTWDEFKTVCDILGADPMVLLEGAEESPGESFIRDLIDDYLDVKESLL